MEKVRVKIEEILFIDLSIEMSVIMIMLFIYFTYNHKLSSAIWYFPYCLHIHMIIIHSN